MIPLRTAGEDTTRRLAGTQRRAPSRCRVRFGTAVAFRSPLAPRAALHVRALVLYAATGATLNGCYPLARPIPPVEPAESNVTEDEGDLTIVVVADRTEILEQERALTEARESLAREQERLAKQRESLNASLAVLSKKDSEQRRRLQAEAARLAEDERRVQSKIAAAERERGKLEKQQRQMLDSVSKIQRQTTAMAGLAERERRVALREKELSEREAFIAQREQELVLREQELVEKEGRFAEKAVVDVSRIVEELRGSLTLPPNSAGDSAKESSDDKNQASGHGADAKEAAETARRKKKRKGAKPRKDGPRVKQHSTNAVDR